jgi:hypothetical protein
MPLPESAGESAEAIYVRAIQIPRRGLPCPFLEDGTLKLDLPAPFAIFIKTT